MKRTALSRGTKRIPQVSKKKAKTRTKAKTAYMMAVKELDCCVCGAHGPSDAHHCRSGGMARDDMKTIPLCYECHRGVNGYHLAKRSWEEKWGFDFHYVIQTQLEILGPG